MLNIRFSRLALLLPVVMLCSTPACCQEPLRQVVVRIIDRVSWAELMQADMPTLKKRVLPNAAVGLMNGGIEGRPSIYGIWVTLGAGRPAAAGPDVFMAAGRYAVGVDVRHPALNDLVKLNRRAGTHATPGLLGTRLRQAGIITALATVTERERHYAAATVMDADGIIDSTYIVENSFSGHVSPGLSPRYRASKGLFLAVDEDYVRKADEDAPPTGLFRLSNKKAAALRRFDDELAQQLTWPSGREKTSLLIIVSASGPGYRPVSQRSLCPVIVYGSGVQRGLLTSASTRTEGLVSNADIAPTILAFFRLKRAANMSGHVLQVVQPRSSLTFLNRLDHEAALAHAFVYPLVKAYVGWQVLVFGFMAWLIFISRAAVQRWGRFALALDLVTLSLPLAFLFSLVLMAQQAWLTGLLTWALAALAGWLAWRLGGLRGLALVSLSTVAVLWLDALTGGLLMRHSIIGYDAVSGTRFYGIGNEYMATMLAASAVGLGFWQQAEGVVRWPFLAAGWLALVLLLGAPDTGANFGGALAAAFVLPFAVWPSIRGAAEGRAQGWRLPAAFLSVILCALVVVWLDLSRHPDLQSHIGQAARLLGHGGITAAIALLVERLTISASLFRHLPLNILGLAICLAAVAVVAVPKGRMSDLRDRFPIAWSGLVAAATAAVAVTLLNDSGVVAGGAAMTFVLGGLLGLAIHSNNEPHPGP